MNRAELPVRFWPVSDVMGTRIDVELGRRDLLPVKDWQDRLRMRNGLMVEVLSHVRGPQFKAFWAQVERSDFV